MAIRLGLARQQGTTQPCGIGNRMKAPPRGRSSIHASIMYGRLRSLRGTLSSLPHPVSSLPFRLLRDLLLSTAWWIRCGSAPASPAEQRGTLLLAPRSGFLKLRLLPQSMPSPHAQASTSPSVVSHVIVPPHATTSSDGVDGVEREDGGGGRRRAVA